VQNFSYDNEFYRQVNENSFSYEKFCTKPPFEKEAQDNSEMAYSSSCPIFVQRANHSASALPCPFEAKQWLGGMSKISKLEVDGVKFVKYDFVTGIL